VLMEIKFRIEADYKYFIASDVVIKHVLTLLHVDSDAQTYKTEKDKSICHQFCYPKLQKTFWTLDYQRPFITQEITPLISRSQKF
jgi:hypothetical protein